MRTLSVQSTDININFSKSFATRHFGYGQAFFSVPHNQHCPSPSPGAPSHSMKAHTAAVRSCHFSRDNFMLATGSDDKVVKVWQVTPTSSRFLTSFDGHSHWVRSVRFSQDDSNLLVTTSDDKSVRIWDVRIGGTAERGGCGGKGRSP